MTGWPLGRPIDGNHDGTPGGDALAQISHNHVQISSIPRAAGMATVSAQGFDVLVHSSDESLSDLFSQSREKPPEQW